MSGDTLRVRLRATRQGPVLRLTGRLSESTIETFVRVVTAALRIRSAQTLALELDAVHYIDISGVAALMQCRRAAHGLGRDLLLTQVSTQVVAGLRACGAGHLLAGRTGPRLCDGMRCRRPSPRHGARRLSCKRLPRGRRPSFHERSQAE
jgi:anti-anti-sigma factor